MIIKCNCGGQRPTAIYAFGDDDAEPMFEASRA